MSKLLTLLFLVLCVYFISCQDSNDSDLTNDEIAKLPTKKLRTMLWQRGLECKGCSEKTEFVKMVQDHISDPIVQGSSSSASGDGASGSSESEKDKDKELEDLMKKLEESGMGGGAKIFRPQDFANLSPEEMQEKMSGSGGGSKRSKRPKSAKPKMTVPEDADTVEL